MKKILVTLAVLAASAHSALAEPISIKIATIAPDGSPWAVALDDWKKEVEKGAPGQVKVKIFKGGALGDEADTVMQVKRGQIQGVGASTGAVATQVPEVNVLELPYLFHNYKETDYIIDNVIGSMLSKHFTDRGLMIGFWSENGFRSFGGKAPVAKMADLRGRKMRSQENPIHISTYRAFGASPVPIPTTEVLTSLQTGVVDGFDNTLLFTFAASWHTAIKYFSVSEHIYQPAVIVFNKGAYDSWPPAIQALVMKAGNKIVQPLRDQIRAMEPILLDNLKASGIAVNEVPAAERAAMMKAAEAVRSEYVSKSSANEKALYNAITAGLKTYRAKHPGQ